MARGSAFRRLAFLAVPLLLVACATSPEPAWVKPGASDAEFHRDDSQCRREAGETDLGAAPGIGAGRRTALNQDIYLACMRGRGWTRP